LLHDQIHIPYAPGKAEPIMPDLAIFSAICSLQVFLDRVRVRIESDDDYDCDSGNIAVAVFIALANRNGR
jgi:hypothetical protein